MDTTCVTEVVGRAGPSAVSLELRFYLRSSPTGSTGLAYCGPLDLDAHWALNGLASPTPSDGPTPPRPDARYTHRDVAGGGLGLLTRGEDEVPLGTVLAMAVRLGRDPEQAGRRRGLAALAAEVQAAIWRRGAWGDGPAYEAPSVWPEPVVVGEDERRRGLGEVRCENPTCPMRYHAPAVHPWDCTGKPRGGPR